MKPAFTKRRVALIAFTVLYAAGFYLWYVVQGNHEFVWYLLEFLCFIVIAAVVLKFFPGFPDSLLALISLAGLLHVIGGLDLEGQRVYGMHLLALYDGGTPDAYIFKYDQLIHMMGFGIAALAFRALLVQFAPTIHALPRNIVAVLAAMGLGALNEVSEFAAILMFHRTGVGGYYDVSLDLIFNMLGALLFVLIAAALERIKSQGPLASSTGR